MLNEVSDWLNATLDQKIPEEVTAFCFNLYDDGDGNWSMELIGTERFDEDDEDWPCDEITDFGTRETPFTWNSDAEWEAVLEGMVSAIKKYLEGGEYAGVLKSKEGIGIGFVDGDIEILYIK